MDPAYFSGPTGPGIWHTDISLPERDVTYWLFGLDINPAVRLEYSMTKDGFGAFTALAGFAVAQGAALTVVARDERRDTIALTVYAIAVLFTAAWTVFMLRTRRSELVEMMDVSKAEVVKVPRVNVRAFDWPSTIYGRFSLGWIIAVGGIMVYLGANQLLPNQTRRVAYLGKDIEIRDPSTLRNRWSSRFAGSGGRTTAERQAADRWLDGWLPTVTPEVTNHKDKEQLVYVEQLSYFKQYYKSFDILVDYDSKRFQVVDSLALLASRVPGTARAVYRQQLVRKGDNNSIRMTLDEPNEGESLIIILLIRVSNTKENRNPADLGQYNIRLTVS